MSGNNKLRLGAIDEIDQVKLKRGELRENGQAGQETLVQRLNMGNGSQSLGSNKGEKGQLNERPMQVGSKEESVNEIDGVKETLNNRIEESS